MPTPTSVDTTAPADHRRGLRHARYDALRVVRRETRLRSKTLGPDGERRPGRVQLCRRAVSDSAGGVAVLVSGAGDSARAGLSGVQTCGSVWACPVCSEKINAGRQAELDAGITAWLSAGHAVLFLTLTMRHNKGHRLADLWDAISPAWNRTTSGAGVAWNGSKKVGGDLGDKARFGIRGYCRVVETKVGDNGWHPHVHALLFIERDLPADQVEDLRRRIFGRWEKALADRGFSTVDEVGADLRPVTSGSGVADYFAKATYGIEPAAAAYEVTGSQSKRLGKGGITPFQLLERLVRDGDERDLSLWHEWEAASQGRRQLTWSRGMRDLLGLLAEKTDEELAEEELDGDLMVTFTVEQWKDWRLFDHVPAILDAAERGRADLAELLTRWGWATRPLPETCE